MFFRYSISALALTAALAASPVHAQLLDADVGAGGVDVSVGGDDGVNASFGGTDTGGVGADVSVGGDTGVGVDAEIGGGSGVGVGVDAGGGSGLGVDAGDVVSGSVIGQDGTVVDADVTIVEELPVTADVTVGGEAAVAGDVQIGNGQTASVDPSATINGGVRLLALGSETARADALIALIADPGLAEIDLDASIDDRRIALVEVSEVLSPESLAQIDVAIGENPEGRADLLAAIEGSALLSGVLAREGVSLDDVLAIDIGANGLTEVLVRGQGEALVADVDAAGIDVLDANADLGSDELAADIDILPGGTGAGGGNLLEGQDLATLDIAALTDEELAALDLTLLPNEEQRLQAVLRILGTDSAGDDSGAGSGSGEAGDGQITILDLDVLLGEAAQADVLATLGGTQEEDALAEVQANALLGQALADAGIAPEAVVAVRLGRNGLVRVLVNSESQVADGGGTSGGAAPGAGAGGDTPAGGSAGDDTGAPPSAGGDTEKDGDNSDGGASPDGGSAGDVGSTDGSDTDTNDTDNDSTDEDGAATGDAGDADAGTGAVADAAAGQPGATPAAGAAAGAVLTADVQAIALPIQKVSCSAAAAAIATGDPAEASDIMSADPSDVSVVQLDGCGTATVPMTAGPAVQTALASNPVLGDVLAQNGVAVTQVVSVTAADDRLTVFVAEPN